MDYVSLFGCNFGYCFWWIIRLNIYNTQLTTTACYETNLLYGDYGVWVAIIVIHIVLHNFLISKWHIWHCEVWCKNTLCISLILPLFCLYIHCGSGNDPMWVHYTILYCHEVTNICGLWVLHVKSHRLQGVKLDYCYSQTNVLCVIGTKLVVDTGQEYHI